MTRDVLYTLKSPYREALSISGFRFGKGEKSACIVGALRGNEVQQQYICSLLVRELTLLESRGALVAGNEVLVVPSAADHSMNLGRRFFSVDNSDLNHLFPGREEGSTAERVADGLFRQIRDYSYGVHFSSFFMPGDFMPHVRMLDTGYQSTGLANLFGLPYVVLRHPREYDTATLGYNWQLWHTNAFSVYTPYTDRLDEASAKIAVDAALRFLNRIGILRYHCHNGYIASVLNEDELESVSSPLGGLFRSFCKPGKEILRGDALGEVIDPNTGEITASITAPTDGMVFFVAASPLVMEHTVVFRIVKRMHG